MEASVATPPKAPEPSHDGEAEATRSTEELFQWSDYVHVGAGAGDCEHRWDGECKDWRHFHAWVCLPNPFQVRDIGDKAAAGRARKIRAMRDPESDSYAVLEAELDEVRATRYDELLQALASAAVERELPEIVREVHGEERFEHYDQDAEALRRLEAQPEEERDTEEYERLQADVLAFAEELTRRTEEREAVELEHLKAMEPDRVVAIERKARIERAGTEMYLHTYYTWAIYTGTRRPVTEGFPAVRSFRQPEDLKVAAPEIVKALREKIRDLESRTTVRSDAAGN